MRIKVSDRFFVPYIAASEIDRAVAEVAGRINYDYSGREPLFISALNGAFMFTSDLIKKITLDCEISFVKVESYEGSKSVGRINQLIGLGNDIAGRDVIIIDDIVDSGLTINELSRLVAERRPASIAVAALIFKPQAYKGGVAIDYPGIVMRENNFIVGYGLDYNGRGRNLPEIFILE